MSISKEKTVELIKKHGSSGSSETQISILTERINTITLHLKENKKDHSARRGLIQLVSKRKKLLNYLRKNNLDSYKKIVKNFDLSNILKKSFYDINMIR